MSGCLNDRKIRSSWEELMGLKKETDVMVFTYKLFEGGSLDGEEGRRGQSQGQETQDWSSLCLWCGW